MTDSQDQVACFLDELLRQEKPSSTVRAYRADLAGFRAWFIQTNAEAFTAAATTRTDIRDYKAHLLTVEKCQPATINRKLAALRSFFLFAQSQGWVDDLPTEKVVGVTSTPRSPKWLDKREIDRLIKAVERYGAKTTKKRDLAILQLLYHTGIREEELVNLTLSDVVIHDRSGKVRVIGKGGKYREVPLNVTVRNALQDYRNVRPSITGERYFLGQRGPLTTRAIRQIVQKYAYHANLPGVSPHKLRHSFGKHILDAGENLVTVSHLMGHSRLETTAIYTQPGAKDKEQAVARLATEE